jgi:hypothetical protein
LTNRLIFRFSKYKQMFELNSGVEIYKSIYELLTIEFVGATTLGIMTLRTMTLGIMAFSIMILSIMTLSIMTLRIMNSAQ